jgi:hypothetical protein
MNYRATSSSPMIYSKTATPPGKRSPTTPPVQFYKHPRTESIATLPSTNMHFSMNNSSY